MKWYKIYLNGENRIWKKCITYSWEFIYEDKEINFQRIIDSSSSERYQIKALIKGKGLIAKSIFLKKFLLWRTIRLYSIYLL